jgi:hypothetical protein
MPAEPVEGNVFCAFALFIKQKIIADKKNL